MEQRLGTIQDSEMIELLASVAELRVRPGIPCRSSLESRECHLWQIHCNGHFKPAFLSLWSRRKLTCCKCQWSPDHLLALSG